MPAPDAAIVAYVIVIGVPLILLAWYYRMYTDIGRTGLTGRESRTSDDRTPTDRDSSPDYRR